MVWTATNPQNCMQYNADTRHPFEDISCLLTHDDALQYFSPLAKTYMDWEFVQRIEPPSSKTIAWTVFASAVIMSVGNFLMLYRKGPFQIRPLVTFWNCLWMAVTGLGFFRMFPLVVHNWWHHSVNDNVCASADSLWLSGTSGLWAGIWIYAKILEVLVESVLVVLLRQPCGLLQWFNNYAYVLVHGWHLFVSPVPGGSAVICVYYGIVWFMNIYCFYLNWNSLPQPSTPTALLDVIHLIQTLSGVALSVTTLHFWKQAVWNHRTCHANEPHIRMLAFSWSGGHVVIVLLSFLNKLYAKSQKHKTHIRRKQKQADNKSVSFAPNSPKGKKKKKLAKEQLPSAATKGDPSAKGDPAPELVEESNSSTSDDAAAKRNKKKKNRNKNVPKNVQVDHPKTPQEEKPEQAPKKEKEGEWETTSKKKKKNKKGKAKD